MPLTEDDKKYILDQFLNNVFGISNKEYQKRVWIRGEGSEVDDFDETVEHFVDDVEIILNPSPKDYTKFKLTKNQASVLQNFRDTFIAFADENYWSPDFIDSVEWEKIMSMAKEVLEVFGYQKFRD